MNPIFRLRPFPHPPYPIQRQLDKDAHGTLRGKIEGIAMEKIGKRPDNMQDLVDYTLGAIQNEMSIIMERQKIMFKALASETGKKRRQNIKILEPPYMPSMEVVVLGDYIQKLRLEVQLMHLTKMQIRMVSKKVVL
eukprot:gnl/Chilomastix_caulleri/2493.p1 GENE.gnl/Chilomastix_caulleri/2493~~gnl/Chilomastix_caulleri/2493.p1  ORF type:complete len:136 (+),score=13.45 gnl/Chilomastix_caulleri/2493:34-441(+)